MVYASIRDNLHRFQQPEAYLPAANPTFGNPQWDAAAGHVLIVRLSPLRDVDRSTPHLFLFAQVRRRLPQAWIDLAFLPPAAERAFLAAAGLPLLVGTQSLRPAADFDLVLISNAYLLELVNLPFLLLNSGIPLWASQRGPDWPPLVLGGSNALACQAVLAPGDDALVDAVCFGEGEQVVGPLAEAVLAAPRARRRAALAELADRVQGLWLAGSAGPVQLARCDPVNEPDLLAEAPVLNTPEARVGALQISYGCPAFCSFCFEGYERKPYRQVPLAPLLEAARRAKRARGLEEMDLLSFCANAHGELFALLAQLQPRFDRIGLKSQRIDLLAGTPDLLEAEFAIDKRSFSLGVEGISQRQRDWLHKSLGQADLDTVIGWLLERRARELKLFYLLTGNEGAADLAEFGAWVRALRERARDTRVIFSFGPLIRMPFTPLQYDRLRLEEEDWQPILAQVRATCSGSGFAFRLAFDLEAYRTSQVLALGGTWLSRTVVDLARRGDCFDGSLPPGYWARLRAALERDGHWSAALVGEKPPDYAFPLAFVHTGVTPAFLYRQFQAGAQCRDTGYCLGRAGQTGHCQACGACAQAAQRQAVTGHRQERPAPGPYLARLRQTSAARSRLEPVFVRVRVAACLAHTAAEFRDAVVFRGLLQRFPEWTDSLLRVRESLFASGPSSAAGPSTYGESVFALTAWDPAALVGALPAQPEVDEREVCALLGHEPGFAPGAFASLHLEIGLPRRHFGDPRRDLERFLRDSHVAYQLRRDAPGYRFDVAARALRKKVLLAGSCWTDAQGDSHARLEVGPRFDLMAFLAACGPRGTHRYADVCVRRITRAAPATVRPDPG